MLPNSSRGKKPQLFTSWYFGVEREVVCCFVLIETTVKICLGTLLQFSLCSQPFCLFSSSFPKLSFLL